MHSTTKFESSFPIVFRLAAWVWLVLAVVCLPSVAVAQEESVKPGINKSFDDPDVDRFIKLFEVESREVYRYRDAIIAVLGIEPGMHVADVGAGTGLFTRLMAPQVGPEGRVYAVDIATKFLDHIETMNQEAGIENVVSVQCDQHSTNLAPESVDRVFVCDTYHHFEYPHATLSSIHRALRPDGRLMLVDFERVRGVSKPFVMGHVRCGKGTVTDEVRDAGFSLLAEIPLMKEQYVLVFEKRPPQDPASEAEAALNDPPKKSEAHSGG